MDENAIYYIWLAGRYKDRCRTKKQLLAVFGGAKEIYEASESDIRGAFVLSSEKAGKTLLTQLADKSLTEAEEEFRQACSIGADVICFGDEDYPDPLRDIPDPPIALYTKGNISVLAGVCVAVVGMRRCSPYGRWAAGKISEKLASLGVCVVSGMASGVDSAAHRGCLAADGKTAAVLGTGIDICFPSSNAGLYREIGEKGLLISEFRPGEHGNAFNFPQRNRIISGLSGAVIVVEAASKSGSLITAGLAADQGRDVLAVPGNINQPGSVGANALIADGACPVTDIDLLPELLGISEDKRSEERIPMSPEEKEIFKLIRESPGLDSDTLTVLSVLSPQELLPLLSAMEIKGIIRSEGSRFFAAMR